MLRVMLSDEDVHKRLSGKVFVHLSHFNPLPEGRVVSEFPTKEYFFNALAASSALPGFSGEPLFTTFEGRIAADGGFTRNTPFFRDGERTQLVIALGWLKYSALYTCSPLDPNHETLVWQGMDDAVSMLLGRDAPALHILAAGQSTESIVPGLYYYLFFDVISWMCWMLTAFGPAMLVVLLTAVAAMKVVAMQRLQIGAVVSIDKK
eukprot:gnl/TRDRNA2_/TRDRNA2_132221_c0_seq1.p1 gnl/TRDRNA2_/TRDRNA2_132221_c0~~gnl/TRDRNA2_/TRDRNA2_132221_c0_seq1.p1  ORF type:complete len:206 (-),score=31.38 gnl/TRDRNA2_/TRDRNA2_132221_c0_seq1:237-854(-)